MILAPNTFGSRLFLYIAPAFLAMILLAAALNIQQQRSLLRSWFIAGGDALVRELAVSAELGVYAESEQFLQSAMNATIRSQDVAYVLLYDADGRILARAGASLGDLAPLDHEWSTPTAEGEIAETVKHRELAGREGRYIDFSAPIVSESALALPDSVLLGESVLDNSEEQTIGFARLGLTTAPLRDQVDAVIRSWIGIAAGVLVASGLVVSWLVRRLTSPLKRLKEHADEIARGNLETTVTVESRDEIGQLATSFDKMARELKSSMDRRDQLIDEVNELNQGLEERIEERTAELVERTNALEEANRHKSEFMANMSHELRTPLNAIIGYSEMLEEDAKAQAQPELVEDLQKIHGSGRHLLRLINDVLDISKIEAGRMDLSFEPIDIREMLNDILSTIKPLAETNNNQIEVDVPADIGLIVTDSTRFRQCLFNLLSNACKFTESGQIWLRVSKSQIAESPAVSFQIEDSGIGMSDEQLEVVFEAFRQADASTTRKYGGTGLGLTITREICQLLGGEIVADSTLDEGSSFTITLPREIDDTGTKHDERRTRSRPNATDPNRGVTADPDDYVLVVDDDPNARSIISRHLERQGYRVRVARNGHQALSIAKQAPPSLIMLDVMMEGLDGWGVLERLKSSTDLNDVPVILATIVEDEVKGQELGAAAHLSKPISGKELIAAVNTHLSQSSLRGRSRSTKPVR